MFYKVNKIPKYLYHLILNDRRTYNTRNLDFVETYFAKQMHLNIHFFPVPYLNGTNLTQTCAMLNHTQRSENHY